MTRQRRTDRFLVLATLFAFSVLVIGHASGQEEGLLAYFKFEEGGGNDLIDDSGLGNDAEIKGDVEWVGGKYEKGMQFDGESGHAEILAGTVGPFEEVTMAAWLKLESMPKTNSYNIIGMTSGSANGFYLEQYATDLAAWQCGPNMNSVTAYPATFSDWHHIAVVYTGDNITIYIDGEQKSQGAGTTLPNVAGSPFRISGPMPEAQGFGGSIDGVIDEVRLYNRALDVDEIIETMESADGAAVTSKGKLSTTWAELRS